MKRAYELGAVAVIAGSSHTDSFDFAKKNGFHSVFFPDSEISEPTRKYINI